MTSHQSVLSFLLALVFIRGVIYASIVPPWQAPDEPAQFERARAALTSTEWESDSSNAPDWYDKLAISLHVFDYWDFVSSSREIESPPPTLDDYIVLYQEAYDGVYSSRPPYAVIGWPLFLARYENITLQLYLVRVNMVLMNIGIVLFAYLITRIIFPKDTFLVLGVPILILFNPQHTHLLSTVNNGNLAELFTLIALYFTVKGGIKGFSWLNILAILAFSLAAMRTKATAYFLPFAIGSVGLPYFWLHRRQWPWLVPISLVLAGLIYLLSPVRLIQLIPPVLAQLGTGDFYLDPIVPQILFRSYWAMPGWLALLLHPFWYQLLAIACILALVGLIILLITKWRLFLSIQFQPQIRALGVLAVAAIVSVMILLSWNAITHSIIYRQGRSIYPVMVPISIFLMLGWRQLIPPYWRKPALLVMTVTLFLFDSMVLVYYITPFFYSRY